MHLQKIFTNSVRNCLTLVFSLTLSVVSAKGQVSGNFTVNGDVDKYYPVTFFDGGWNENIATELTIGRSLLHLEGSYRGSVIAAFRFHVQNWGYMSNFIDADIRQFPNSMVAGWHDATFANNSSTIIVWLKGGSTTYAYHSNYNVTPKVYDGVQNALPFQEISGAAHTYKTVPESYVNYNGASFNHSAYFNGDGMNYFKGNVGIGTTSTAGGYKLLVNGNVRTRKVRVDQETWADYVFDSNYKLRSLKEVEQYIQQEKHLPDVPSSAEVKKEGLDLGDNQAILLEKIEELTLYVIDQNKKIEEQNRIQKEQQQLIKDQGRLIQDQNKRLDTLNNQLNKVKK